MNLAEIEKRLQALEDIEAIKKLKARYCAYCDEGYDADGIANLFTEDGVWDGGLFGRFEGREAIRSFFQGASQMIPFALHYVTNSAIEVEGDQAQGTWYLFQACTFAEGNQAVWGAGRYQEKYIRIGGEWKFKNLTVASFFWTPYEQGWVKRPFLQEGN